MGGIGRRRLLASTAALGLAGLAPAARAAAPARGGTLVFGRYADSLLLDPVLTGLNVDIWILTNIYDTLIQPSADGKSLEPGLAESWTVSPDGKSVTLKLRPGLKFADGSPLTTDDVIFSLARAADQKVDSEWGFLFTGFAGVTAPDASTIAIALKQPNPAILQLLTMFATGIMPKALIMAQPGASVEDKAKAFAQKPLGSGPFYVKSWQRNSEMVLARNPYYWKDGADGKKLPYLDAVQCLIIPDDATRILKLKAGGLDMTEFVPFARVQELRADPSLDMVLFPAEKVFYGSINTSPTKKDGSKNPLADQRVRQALNYATNKDAILQVVTYGNGAPMRSFMPMTTPLAWGPPSLYPYDVGKAQALLKAAGYANGFDAAYMVIAGNQDYLTQATALQQMWRPIGVRLTIDPVDNATGAARWHALDYDFRASLWTNDINDPSELGAQYCDYGSSKGNWTGWKNDQVQALFEQSQGEMDAAKRAAQYKQIQQIFDEAAPILFLGEEPYPVALRKTVHDFVQIPLGNNIFVAAWKG